MLSTENALYASLFVSLFAVIVGFAALIIARSAASYARAVEKYLRAKAPKSEIAALHAELTELTDSYGALLKSHKRLRSRITMRETREKGRDNDPEDELGSIVDKRQLRLAAKGPGS